MCRDVERYYDPTDRLIGMGIQTFCHLLGADEYIDALLAQKTHTVNSLMTISADDLKDYGVTDEELRELMILLAQSRVRIRRYENLLLRLKRIRLQHDNVKSVLSKSERAVSRSARHEGFLEAAIIEVLVIGS